MNENGPDSRDYTNPPCERSSAFWFLNALIYHNYHCVRIYIPTFLLCADDRYACCRFIEIPHKLFLLSKIIHITHLFIKIITNSII